MAIVTLEKTTARPAPLSETTALGWLRINLFSSVFNTVLTVISLYVVYLTVSSVFTWGYLDATFIADNRRECYKNSLTGACWAGIINWFNNMFYGRYPDAETWGVNSAAVILILWMAPLWMSRVRGKILIAVSVVVFYPFLAGYLFAGGAKSLLMNIMVTGAIVAFALNLLNTLAGLFTDTSIKEALIKVLGQSTAAEGTQRKVLFALLVLCFAVVFTLQSNWLVTEVSWTRWGGLFLTFVISGIAMALSLPLGIVLALGRRSELPAVRVLSTGFIEIFRSVPLITVLFMATTMFPLFMPDGFFLNNLVQVIIAVTLFNACYMAEIVRAGLQAIPKGQFEGAHTIGLGYWGTMGLIIMPQALKHMIPNIVGNLIGLLKDTTLVSIIGLFDVLGMLRSISKDVPWLGLHKEPLVFGGLLFFVICFSMSKYSRHLEFKLSAGSRR